MAVPPAESLAIPPYHHGLRGGSRGVGVISGRGDCRNGSSVVIGPSQGATANGVIVSCSPDSIVQHYRTDYFSDIGVGNHTFVGIEIDLGADGRRRQGRNI